MKRLICRLAQRRLDPSGSQAGWLARHLDSCPDCRTYLDHVRSIESRLYSSPPESDEVLCDEIMCRIRTARKQAAPAPRSTFRFRPWILGAGLATTAAVVIAVITPSRPTGDEQAEAKPSAEPFPPVVVPEDPPDPRPANPPTLANLMQQQELLQRDARKLGAHLRERVILFRPVN